ncbi:MAG: hemerythrin domain-containing protein [Rhodospirillaceae bacterium]|jgi:iron-sulfur cluster repair protein YtfE (RIC family)|nr:hemerythrin domain-containing protein [Rhodospirillaceae bacterium]
MNFSRRSAQLLHEDHDATLALLKRLEDLIARSGRVQPDTSDSDVRTLLENTATAIDGEVHDHFAFEEDDIFPKLIEDGETEICEHLRQDHLVILPIAERVSALAKRATETGFTEQTWPQFRTDAGDLIERLLAHVEKEEMALLPVMDELIDPEADFEISAKYSGGE